VERFLLRAVAPEHCGARQAMKIYFLLMLISLFVWLSYMPIGMEAKQKVPARPNSFSA
jgi:hypothetical protein